MKQNDYLKVFQQDLKEFIQEQFKELIRMGKLTPTKQSNKFLATAEYMNLLRSYIYNRQRIPYGKKRVIYSKEILKSPFYKAFKKKIDNIVLRFTQNGDISQYLTKKINNFETKDDLLSDWGILHLHLYPFKERPNGNDNLLLFIYIRGDNVFFLDVGNHRSFADKHLLEIIDNNWPSLLNTLNGISGEKFTSEEIINLRKYNLAYALAINGKSVTPMIDGVQNNLYIPMVVNKLLAEIAEWTKNIDKDVIEELSKYHKKTINKVDMHLYFDKMNQKVILCDAITRTGLRFNDDGILGYLENVLKNANIF